MTVILQNDSNMLCALFKNAQRFFWACRGTCLIYDLVEIYCHCSFFILLLYSGKNINHAKVIYIYELIYMNMINHHFIYQYSLSFSTEPNQFRPLSFSFSKKFTISDPVINAEKIMNKTEKTLPS